jgi:hypothetical protein
MVAKKACDNRFRSMAISVEQQDGGEQTPTIVDFVEPTWTEQEHEIRAAVGCECFISIFGGPVKHMLPILLGQPHL